MLLQIRERTVNTDAILDLLTYDGGKTYVLRLTPQSTISPENESRIQMSVAEHDKLIAFFKTEGLLKQLAL